MWLLLFALLIPGSFFLITLLFGLVSAGRRADEAEERILEILVSQSPQVRIAGGIAAKRKRQLYPPASGVEVSADK